MKNAWSFVEQFYPNYSSCSEILRNEELNKKAEEGDTSVKNDLAISNSDIYEKSINSFNDTFTSWHETHFEISVFIYKQGERNKSNYIKLMQGGEGIASLWELAKKWTDEFEQQYRDTVWGEDLDYYDTIEAFLEEKLANLK